MIFSVPLIKCFYSAISNTHFCNKQYYSSHLATKLNTTKKKRLSVLFKRISIVAVTSIFFTAYGGENSNADQVASVFDENLSPAIIPIVTGLLLTVDTIDEWEVLDLTLNGIAPISDDHQDRLFYSIGAGYETTKSHKAKIEYDTSQGYAIGFNNGPIVAKGTDYEFGDMTCGNTVSIQMYHGGVLQRSYDLIFSNMPVIMLKAPTITNESKRPGTFHLASLEYEQNTEGLNMGLEYHGQTSLVYPKKPYGIEFTKSSTLDESKNVSLLDMRKDDDWILDPAYRDTTFVRNLVCHDLWLDMRNFAFVDKEDNIRGQPTIKGMLTEVIQDNQYQGIYVLEEKVDRKLLDLTKIDVPKNEVGDELWDEVDFSNPANGSVLYKADIDATMEYPDDVANNFDQKYPKKSDIEHYGPLEELVDFVANGSNAEFIADIGNRVDIDNVVDFWLLTVVSGSTDTLRKNYFLSRSEDQKFFMIPWDMDATFAMWWDGSEEASVDKWPASQNMMIRRLIELTETGFNTKMKARWNELKTTLFSKDSIMARFEVYSAQLRPITDDLNNAFERNKDRWPDSGGEGSDTPELGTTAYIRDWYQRRLIFLDDKISNLLE